MTTKRGERFNLNSPPGATLVIGHLEDTTFKDAPAEVNKWGKFYLPTTVEMQVVGYVEGSPYPCDQLVLMTCDDKKFYGYDEEEEELHLVATSLNYLCEKGIDYPASKSYYRGEAFKDMVSFLVEHARKTLRSDQVGTLETEVSLFLCALSVVFRPRRTGAK